MKKFNVLTLVLCALFAALSAVLSQVMIPIGAVPITLTHLSIFIAAGLLGAKYGALSQIVFVCLGAIGVPVFAGFAGGIGILLGPTGGFIFGYIACAFITGLIATRFGKSLHTLIIAMTAGLLITYIFGICWFMYITKTGVSAALMTCVVPFLLGDALKIIVSAILVNRLSPLLSKKLSSH